MSVFAPNKVALITGGASGIGLAIAKLCRSHGMRVVVADRNAATLPLAKETLGGSSDTVETCEVDVSKPEEWTALRDRAVARFGGVDLLVLNAAIAGKRGPVEWEDGALFERVMATNFFGVVHGLGAFVPLLRASEGPSAIVVTGSKQGITNPPGNPAYNASKAAIKSLTEQLSYSLRETQVAVHLLVPGMTFTGIGGGEPDPPADKKPAGAWMSSQVADYLYAKMEKKAFYIVCPDDEVTEEMDKKRMTWAMGDVVEGRQPLSRWREEYKEEVAKKLG